MSTDMRYFDEDKGSCALSAIVDSSYIYTYEDEKN